MNARRILRFIGDVTITCVPVAVGVLVLYGRYFPEETFWQVVVESLLGIIVAFFAIVPFSGLVEYYLIVPNRNRPALLLAPDGKNRANNYEYPLDPRGLFTDLQPGREKIFIAPGGRFVKMLLDDPEHVHKGDLGNVGRDPAKHWRIVALPDDTSYWNTHAIPFPTLTVRTWYRVFFLGINLLWWVWKRYIYSVKGVVWVGPSWFRQVRFYKMPRMTVTRVGTATQADRSDVQIEEVNDYSDHYRTRDFQLAVLLPNVNCQNNIALRVTILFNGRVANAWLAAFGTDDRWSVRLAGLIAGAVREFAAFHPASQVLAAKGQGMAPPAVGENAADQGAGDLAKYVARIGYEETDNDLSKPVRTALPALMGSYSSDGGATAFGIITSRTAKGEFLLPQILDVSPITDKDAEALAAPAFAQAKMEGDLLDAKGKAAYIDEEGAAIERHKESGNLVAQLRAQVDTADAATRRPGAIVVVNTGGQQGQGTTDPMQLQLAILAELRRLNAGGGNPPDGETTP